MLLTAGLLCWSAAMAGQVAPAVVPGVPAEVQEQEAPRAPGTVLFSGQKATDAIVPAVAEEMPRIAVPERSAGTFTGYDLDVHLTPASAGVAARAAMTLRNDSAEAMGRVVLQVSSTLRFERVTDVNGMPLRFVSQAVDTDADHTGAMTEAVVTLPAPLAPGASMALTAVYSGTIRRSSGRLDRLGAPAAQAGAADWDEATGSGLTSAALRGFGSVLWYPVSAVPVFLGDGAEMVKAVGRMRFRERAATMRLRLAVEYTGEAPVSAYFLGRREQMTVHSENQDVPVAEAPGIATAEFGGETLGFRAVSLFVTEKPESLPEGGLLSIVSEQDDAAKAYDDAAHRVQPMLAEWFGAAGPAEPLHVIDHAGQTFEDGPLLVTAMRAVPADALAPGMAAALSHAWTGSRTHAATPWIEEGLARFMYTLWLERTDGRESAVRELQRAAVALALAEPPPSSGGDKVGQSLVDARDEVYFETKAAAVWWMLRGIVGDDALRVALVRYRREAKSADDSGLLERVLEQAAGVSLAWFFDDWVYADKGLPDLSIVRVTPRELATKGGKTQGWLVAVEVKNDGDAVAEVPVTVRAGGLSATERIRVAGQGTASTRILFEKEPEEVLVNDGTVPELRTSVHRRKITMEAH